MDYFAILCFVSILLGGGGGLYWFFWVLGSAEVKGNRALNLTGGSIAAEKIQESYYNYWSFFFRPKEITDSDAKADKVPDFVDTFYNLVTDIYEWRWGQSFHFSPSIPGKSHREAMRLHEVIFADLIQVKPGDKVLDVGCGVGGPMRSIAAHSGSNIVGITINEYQVNRAVEYNRKAGLDSLCSVVLGNFLEMPFDDGSFDGAYSIEATCHAPKLEEVYAETFRVLKPGGLFVSSEWVTTDKYVAGNQEHVDIVLGIERGNALPGLRHYTDIAETARKVGFEVVMEKNLAVHHDDPAAGPWWTRLEVGKISQWRSHIVVTVLSALRIAPKGIVDVHDMLCQSADHLCRGGETGIFSPMYIILCRKPHIP